MAYNPQSRIGADVRMPEPFVPAFLKQTYRLVCWQMEGDKTLARIAFNGLDVAETEVMQEVMVRNGLTVVVHKEGEA